MPRCAALVASLLLTAGLGACSGDNGLWGSDAAHPAVATPDPVAVRLADAAQKASSALQSLAAVEQARTPSPLPAVTPSGDDLDKPITVAWNGPAAPLALRLATRVGYHFREIGTPPTVPATVTVDVIEQPVMDVLRDVGLQLGTRANLVIDANRKTVELQYATVGQ